MSRMRMVHVTHMSESRHTYKWVMSHTWMRCCTHKYESFYKCKWVNWPTWNHIDESTLPRDDTSVWFIYVIVMKSHTPIQAGREPRNIMHAYEWIMSHMNESCHIWMSHVTCHVWTSNVIYHNINKPHTHLSRKRAMEALCVHEFVNVIYCQLAWVSTPHPPRAIQEWIKCGLFG